MNGKMKKSDKLHIIGCMVLVPLLTILFGSISKGALGTFLVGVIREILNELAKRIPWVLKITSKIKIHGTGFSIRDIIYNIIGCAAGVAIVIIYILIRYYNGR